MTRKQIRLLRALNFSGDYFEGLFGVPKPKLINGPGTMLKFAEPKKPYVCKGCGRRFERLSNGLCGECDYNRWRQKQREKQREKEQGKTF